MLTRGFLRNNDGAVVQPHIGRRRQAAVVQPLLLQRYAGGAVHGWPAGCGRLLRRWPWLRPAAAKQQHDELSGFKYECLLGLTFCAARLQETVAILQPEEFRPSTLHG